MYDLRSYLYVTVRSWQRFVYLCFKLRRYRCNSAFFFFFFFSLLLLQHITCLHKDCKTFSIATVSVPLNYFPLPRQNVSVSLITHFPMWTNMGNVGPPLINGSPDILVSFIDNSIFRRQVIGTQTQVRHVNLRWYLCIRWHTVTKGLKQRTKCTMHYFVSSPPPPPPTHTPRECFR